MRAEPRHSSEMVSEILFGETFEIIDRQDNWLKIQLTHDRYTGWIDFREHFPEAEKEMNYAVMEMGTLSHKDEEIILPIGSYVGSSERIHINNKAYSINARVRMPSDHYETEHLLSVAMSFLNTPYYWGGRSKHGIDCSGLVQVVYSVFGINLPRDAYQQATVGKAIPFSEHTAGDLAFFANDEGKIIHVGILMPRDQILHSSEKVRVDRLDATGIWRLDIEKYSHQLHSIRRVIS